MSDTPETESEQPIDDEIERAMAEAEAAVGAVRAGKPGEDESAASDEHAERPAGEPAEEGDSGTVIEIDSHDGEPEPESDLAAEVAAAREQVESMRDKWLRSVADHENYKKRVKRDIDDAVHRAVSKLLDDFLGVPDNLERALEAAKDDDSQLVTGIRMVMTSFMSALAKHGIQPVASVGHAFDPAIHDALQQFDSPEHAPGIIIQEFEKGYTKDDRLLRPARVIVAGAGSTGAAPESADEGDADAEGDAATSGTPAEPAGE